MHFLKGKVRGFHRIYFYSIAHGWGFAVIVCDAKRDIAGSFFDWER